MARRPRTEAQRIRERAQRRTARQLKRGERPLGGEYQKHVVASYRRMALQNVRTRIGHYFKYDDDTVYFNIYQVMNLDQILWTINADAEEIRSRASNRFYIKLFDGDERNPWWYHPS